MFPYVEMEEMLRKQPKGMIGVGVSADSLARTMALGVTACKEKELGTCVKHANQPKRCNNM